MNEMSKEKILEKINADWDFEKLLEPYLDGGTVDNPTPRSWGTIIDWLMNKHKFPPDIVGAGIFLVWMQIKSKGHFKPDIDADGKQVYGSAGHKFVHAIRVICASLIKQKMSQQIFSGMAGEVETRIKTSMQEDMWNQMPWPVKAISSKYWQYRAAKKRLAKKGVQ